MNIKNIRKFFTPKRILVIVSFFCVVLTVTSFFTDKLATPLRNAVSCVVVPIQKGINSIGMGLVQEDERNKSIEELAEENTKLKEKVQTLESENSQLKEQSSELEKLREFYKMEDTISSYTKVGARIIGSTSNNVRENFMIDKGKSEGIDVDMNVITDEGLVGIVSEVYDQYSVVTTIVADNAKVSAMDESTNDICTVNGDITMMDSGVVSVTGFKADANVNDGDRIITSNISSKYLPRIFVGYLRNVTVDSSTLSKSGEIIPAVDFDHLTDVIVITTKKSDYTNQ